MRDSDLQANRSRHEQLREIFDIRPIEPECQDEYVRIPLDLPWKHLEKDVERAYRKFGWYGMVHRKNHQWNRSRLYGGLGLTYNPDYVHDIDTHAHCLGEPRSTREVGLDEWSYQSSTTPTTIRWDYEYAPRLQSGVTFQESLRNFALTCFKEDSQRSDHTMSIKKSLIRTRSSYGTSMKRTSLSVGY